MIKDRFYRNSCLPEDLTCYEVQYKETDLFCCTKGDLREIIMERILFYRNQLEEYIKLKPAFLHSLTPIDYDILAPEIVKSMLVNSLKIGVGPMATVAGAVAEFVGRDIEGLSEEFIIENGGDIYLKTKRERTVMVYAKDSPLSQKIGLKLRGGDRPLGICTSSGTFGHSLSFGKADAVCVVSGSSTFSDGLATYLGNMVKNPESIRSALDVAKSFDEVIGVLIIVGDHMGVFGDIEIVKI